MLIAYLFGWSECFQTLEQVETTNCILENDRPIFPEVYSAYINVYKDQKNFISELDKLFLFFQANDIKCNKDTALLLQAGFGKDSESRMQPTVISDK